ncbi:MAG: hypothetical protein GYA58_03245 [Anaerolineaceae bacterium]|nr:hypothetical protein [Anaerolineaceae bacterium]
MVRRNSTEVAAVVDVTLGCQVELAARVEVVTVASGIHMVPRLAPQIPEVAVGVLLNSPHPAGTVVLVSWSFGTPIQDETLLVYKKI